MDIQSLENTNAKLYREVKDKSQEIEELRKKQEILIKDSQIFDNYLNSIKSDEAAIRLIIQKV